MTDDGPDRDRRQPRRPSSRSTMRRRLAPAASLVASRQSTADWVTSLDVAAVVAAACDLLGDTGLAVAVADKDIDTIARWRQGGANAGSGRVRFDRAIIERWLAAPERSFDHLAADTGRSLTIGAGHGLRLGPPLWPSRLWSGARDRRPLTTATLADALALARGMPELDYGLASLALGLHELDLPQRHQLLFAVDTRPLIAPIAGGLAMPAPDIAAVARGTVAGVGAVAMRPRCTHLGVAELEHALTLPDPLLGAMLALATAGHGVVIAPVLLLGANAPLSPEGALVRFAAEVLGTALLLDAVRPGMAMAAGVIVAEVSMRNGLPMASTAAALRVLAGARAVCRRLGLPVYALGPATAGKGLDGQSGAETALWLSAVADYDVALGLGGLELDVGLSLEKLVLDADLARAVAAPVPAAATSTEAVTVGASALRQVGPGGDFLSHPDTRDGIGRGHGPRHGPRLADQWLYESWVAAGAPDATERARVVAAELMMASVDRTAVDPAAAIMASPQAAAAWPALAADTAVARQPLADLASAIYSRAMRDAFGFKG